MLANTESTCMLSLSTVVLVLLPAVIASACAGNSLPADGILATYFDLAVGSAPGTFVSGRLNPYVAAYSRPLIEAECTRQA